MDKAIFSRSICRITAISVGLSVACSLLGTATVQAQSNPYAYDGSSGTSSSSGMTMNNGFQSASNKGALGLVVNWNPQGRLVVTQIVPGGPAANAGVSVGDRLFSIDGKNIDGLPAAQVFASIVGSVGTTAVLSLESPTKGQYEARITRVPVDALNKSSNFNVGWQVNSPNQQSGQSSDNISGQNNSVNNNSVSTTNNTNSYSYQSGGVTWNVSGGGEAGYSLKYPNGWTVEQNAKTGRIEVKSPDASRLSIFPFFLPDQNIDVPKAQGLFQVMLKKYAPGPQWSAPMMVGGGLRAMSTSGGVNSIAGLALSGGNGGTSGSLIVFQIPNNQKAQSELATMSQILQSFTITGAPQQQEQQQQGTGYGGDDYQNQAATTVNVPAQNIQFTKFVDPNFNAFSLDVPAGWNVTGGMKRPMPVDLRPWVKAVSPDQKIVIFIGDGAIEPRYLPAGWLTWMGCPPGATYKTSAGLVTKVLYYQSADKFVRQYAESRMGKACDTFELVNVEHHPDLARSINGTQGVVASDAASVKYNFTAKGNAGEAYFLAATKKGKTMWWVSQICGVAAVKGYEEEALAVFLRMYKSWEYSPQWSQGQAAQNVQFTQNWIAYDRAARARSAAAFQSRMAAMDARHEAFRSRMAAMDASHSRYMNSVRSSDRAHSSFINYIRDEDTLMNPETGTQYQVEYGPKYHWVNNTGDVTLGTNSAWSPGANWTELVTPPR